MIEITNLFHESFENRFNQEGHKNFKMSCDGMERTR